VGLRSASLHLPRTLNVICIISMRFTSKDYKKEPRNSKTLIGGALISSLVVLGLAIFNPIFWKFFAKSIFSLLGVTFESSKEEKSGAQIGLLAESFEYEELESGYKVTIPYAEIQSVSSSHILGFGRLKISLSENRELILNNFEKAKVIGSELKTRANI